MIELGDLGLDEGAHLLIARALSRTATIEVIGSASTLAVDLPAWCRAKGHAIERAGEAFLIRRGDADRTVGAERAGTIDRPVEHAPARWGLAARGARVEAGSPEFRFALDDKDDVWTDDAARMYTHAAAACA